MTELKQIKYNRLTLINKIFKYNREYLTGLPIFLPISVRQLRGEDNEQIASLDRIDNAKDYIEGNLQWICNRIPFRIQNYRTIFSK